MEKKMIILFRPVLAIVGVCFFLLFVGQLLLLSHSSTEQMREYSLNVLPPTSEFTNSSLTAFSKQSLNYQPTLIGPRSWEKLGASRNESQGRTNKSLNFIHIPKTGGSSILTLSAGAGFKWGGCLFPSPWGKDMCPRYNETNTHWGDHPHGTTWWHVPIQYLDPAQPNPYAGSDVFAVVRNPYERAVSEYYYHCKLHRRKCFGRTGKKDTAERLNAALQPILKQVLWAAKNSSDYFVHWGHWIPQYDYIYDTTRNIKLANGNTGHPRNVQHVLHSEVLNDEFQSLMQAYGLPLRLPRKHLKARSDLNAKLGVESMSLVTMKLIEVVYEKDFALGGYEMLSGKHDKQYDGR